VSQLDPLWLFDRPKSLERTVATYQTLLEAGRLLKFSPQGLKAVVVDEAHHAAAPSYVSILRLYGGLKRTFVA
jgi:superfamily II DNA or RNA helicase